MSQTLRARYGAEVVETGEKLTPQEALHRVGPTFPVTIKQNPTAMKAYKSAGKEKEANGQSKGYAVIDTATPYSCIDLDAAKHAHLPARGVANLVEGRTVRRHMEVFTGIVELHVEGQGTIAVAMRSALGLEISEPGIILLMGRDILARCTLIYDGRNGAWELTMHKGGGT